jgi:hypothetical protein
MNKYESRKAEAMKMAKETGKQVVLGWPMFASLRNSPQLMSPEGKKRVISSRDLKSLRQWVWVAYPDGTFCE